jgi:hypothetical protein
LLRWIALFRSGSLLLLLLRLPLLHRRGVALRRLALQGLGFAFQILGVPQQRLPIAVQRYAERQPTCLLCLLSRAATASASDGAGLMFRAVISRNRGRKPAGLQFNLEHPPAAEAARA